MLATLNDTTDGMAHFKCPDTNQSIVHLIDSHINLHTDQDYVQLLHLATSSKSERYDCWQVLE